MGAGDTRRVSYASASIVRFVQQSFVAWWEFSRAKLPSAGLLLKLLFLQACVYCCLFSPIWERKVSLTMEVDKSPGYTAAIGNRTVVSLEAKQLGIVQSMLIEYIEYIQKKERH